MRAYVLRINPDYVDKIEENRNEDRISIGWSYANKILNPGLNWEQFREIIHQEYYSDKQNYRASGNAAGSLWRFIKDMKINDYVLIPSMDSTFYIAQVTSDVEFIETKMDDETAFSRKVIYLNDKKPIERKLAKSGIISRLKVYQTCVEASDLIEDIESLLNELKEDKITSFDEELRRKVIETILIEIKTGKIDNFGFEKLLKNLFLKLGASNCKIVPRKLDKGSDLLIEFLIAKILPVNISVQAKHWQDYSPVSVQDINQLENGMKSDGSDYGIFITSGVYSEESIKYTEKVNEEKPTLYLIDGLELSNMLFLERVLDYN